MPLYEEQMAVSWWGWYGYVSGSRIFTDVRTLLTW